MDRRHGIRQGPRRQARRQLFRRQRSRAFLEGLARNHLPSRSQRLRRPLVQRGLAAGTAQAGHQPQLGQRGASCLALRSKSSVSKKTTSSRLTVGSGKVKAPVIVAPGHPDNSVTRLSGLRPRVCRPGRFRGRLQRLPHPHHMGAVLCHRLHPKVEGKWGIAITKSHSRITAPAKFGGKAMATTRSKPMRRSA